jgi:Reverse transcriptase (RNA-dependent DNA polymerase)
MSRRHTPTGPALIGPVRWDVVAKPDGGLRRLVVLCPVDEVAFSRSVAGVAPAIDRARARESYADAVVAWDGPQGLILEPWRSARRRWQHDVWGLGSLARFVAVTDVRACYASISPDVVTDRLRALGANEARVEEIGSWLRSLSDAGVEGLPVGPSASAPLADAVLSVGDDAIRATGVAHTRWVDDVTIFALDAGARAAAFKALREAWASLGLEVHDGKTVFLDASEEAARLGTAGSPAASCSLR